MAPRIITIVVLGLAAAGCLSLLAKTPLLAAEYLPLAMVAVAALVNNALSATLARTLAQPIRVPIRSS